MKKALLLLSFVHLLAACTNDIEILPNDESQKLMYTFLLRRLFIVMFTEWRLSYL